MTSSTSQRLQIEGSDGNDRINGTDGNDIINSNNGDDTINSGAGDDTINGGRGNDILDGGAGTDVLALFDLNRGDENIGFVGSGNNFTFFVDGANEGTFLDIELVQFDNGEVVSTEDLDFTDAIASSDLIFGNDGDDLLEGGVGNDTLTGQVGVLTSFNLEDVTSPIDGGIVADVGVNLDYADGIDASDLKDITPIGNYIEDFLADYPVEAGLYEVLNRDLTEGLLDNSELGLSEVLDSISVNLDVEPKIIPFQFDTTITRTDSGEINDVVSFELKDVISPIVDASVADIGVELDYVDGIDSSGFKDVIPLGDYVEDYLTNYSNTNDSIEVVNNNLGNALLSDTNLGLCEVLDSLTITIAPSPGVIPFPSQNIVTLTPDETTIFGESDSTAVL